MLEHTIRLHTCKTIYLNLSLVTCIPQYMYFTFYRLARYMHSCRFYSLFTWKWWHGVIEMLCKKLLSLIFILRCCVRLATLLRHVACCWLKFETSQIWANNTQHVATCRNKVAKRTQHVAPNNVATCCVGMSRSFGQGFEALQILTFVHLITRHCERLCYCHWKATWQLVWAILIIKGSSSFVQKSEGIHKGRSTQIKRIFSRPLKSVNKVPETFYLSKFCFLELLKNQKKCLSQCNCEMSCRKINYYSWAE